MAKKKDENNNENSLYENLAKSVGGELLEDTGKVNEYIDTGILSLNYVISGKFVGGGLPVGCCAEIYGDSSSGKTLIGTNLLRGSQTANGIAAFLDSERTLNKEFARKASKVDPKKVILMEADTLEKCFAKIFKLIKQAREVVPMERHICIVYDSIAVSPSEREFSETEVDMETATKAQLKEVGAGTDKPGEKAKIIGKELRKLTPILAENNATVLFVNQLREKIGILYGDSSTTAAGGRALPFYATCRLRISSFKKIEDNLGNIIGVNVSIKNTKNKCFKPFVEVKNLRLFFDKGIDPLGGLLTLLLQCGRITAGAAGNYTVNEPWAGGKEVKFKSSKERNDIPADVLLECPALVDATSPEQVQYYIDMFGEALEAVENDIAKEVEVGEEE